MSTKKARLKAERLAIAEQNVKTSAAAKISEEPETEPVPTNTEEVEGNQKDDIDTSSSSEGEEGSHADSNDDSTLKVPFANLISDGIKAGISEFMTNELPTILQSQISNFLSKNDSLMDRNTSASAPQSPSMATKKSLGTPEQPRSIFKDPASYISWTNTESTTIGPPTTPKAPKAIKQTLGNFYAHFILLCVSLFPVELFFFFSFIDLRELLFFIKRVPLCQVSVYHIDSTIWNIVLTSCAPVAMPTNKGKHKLELSPVSET